MAALTDMSLLEVSAKIRAREVSPVEVTEACLARAEATEPKLNAFSNLMPEKARAAAKAAEAEIAAGAWRGPLHGIPVGIKELYDVAGEPTTSSSCVRANSRDETDSASVARLRAAGAVIMGKTHTHEFAYGFVTPESRNPWNPDHIPGGSSGGSGAAVAAGSCYMGMGSDTGGSIRQPSALCGTVGLKPTFGRCSRVGVTSLSWSLDHVGPLTRTVADAAVTLNALAGHDPRDPGSVDVPVEDYAKALGRDAKGLRIGVPKNHFFDLLHPEVESAVRGAVDALAAEGAIVSEVEIPYADQLMAVEFAICLPEASEYHRRMLRETPDLYLPDVQEVLERGEMIPATRYVQALRLRRLIQQGWAEMMRDVDVVIAPASAVPAPKVGEEEIDWGQGVTEPLMNTFARITAPGNVVGLPAIAMPCGFSSGGLPLGFQAIGRPFEESTVIRLCDAYERMTDWTSRRPAI
jgi:aspartyl-tRNA(Asn)/glutamyl-tRNA(Gln) amidotransferase subunit A